MEKFLHFLEMTITFKRGKFLVNFIAFAFIVMQSMTAYSQNVTTKFTLSVKNAPLKTVFESMRKQSNLDFVYSDDEIKNFKVTLDLKNTPLKETMAEVLKNLPLVYQLKGNTMVVILPKVSETAAKENLTIQGKLIDETKAPVVGATLIITGTAKGAVSDDKGNFSLIANHGDVLEINCVGMTPITYVVSEQASNLVLKMNTEALAVEDVVVTGIYTRKADSFTGSYSSFSAKDLQSVGGNNIIQSLKTLDPSFNVLESNQFGSDPNRLPDIEIRGKSSMLGTKEQYETDPNQPLFILDGMEANLQAIFNLDMNRIASVTILKDAASTAIYGSKAANGVVVVETLKPIAGKLRLSYNGTFSLSMPDLTSYNLMNASEKLEYERLSGSYKGQQSAENDLLRKEIYNKKLQDVISGVDTYWLGEPLRVGLNQRHSISVDGGEGDFSFSIGGGYNSIDGVMKGSDRDILSGNIDLSYKAKKLIFYNKFSIDYTTSSNPLVAFSEYAKANPYYKRYNDEGNVERLLENNALIKNANPMYNAQQNSRNKSINHVIRNIFQLQYNLNTDIRATAKFGLTRTNVRVEDFISPDNTAYDGKDILDKGDYTSALDNSLKYEGEVSITYGKLFNEKHLINAVVGGNINNTDIVGESYSVHGFPSGDFDYPSFSNGYPKNGKPRYNNSTTRSLSAFLNTGYSYDNRYLLDASYRMNGASIFGTSKKFAHTWSVGLAWNLHNEEFMKSSSDIINVLKIRASIGNPGNQNFDSNMIYTTFGYNFSSFNYFGLSSQLGMLGNPNLEWQTTLDKNIGLEMRFLQGRLSFVADYYRKVTDPLLIRIETPSSVGVTETFTNMGEQKTWGASGTVKYNIIHRPADRIIWSVGANFRTDKSKIDGVGNSLDAMNKSGQKSRTLSRYYDGSNPDDLWAVKSRGIDPASGREIFVDKNGKETFDYSYDNEVIVGNSRPKLEGTINSVFSYKGFTVDVYFRYRLGADVFNEAVYYKVENISNVLSSNQDKRALYNRWQKPGDVATYKDIASATTTPISSRFVQRENILSLESVKVTYELPRKLMDSWKMSSIRVSAYANDIVRFSTIKSERGTEYPFARAVNLMLSINF